MISAHGVTRKLKDCALRPTRKPTHRLGQWISGLRNSNAEATENESELTSSEQAPRYRRFLSDQQQSTEGFLQAARQYMTKMSGFEREWLYRKPYDPRPGNDQFFPQVYTLMNLIKAMDVRSGGRFLEVGSGPGWVSELLMLLGYEVDGVEPCEELVDIAKKRIENATEHYHVENPPQVTFHLTTLEECQLDADTFDAVLFHDALHHVIDEDKSIEQCFRYLKPGGVLGVTEAAWRPGNRMQESTLEKEIFRFGTYESPYTQEYLDHLLTKHGFQDIERYHSINGFFSADMGQVTIEQAAHSPAAGNNNLTAWKLSFKEPTTLHPDVSTQARIEIVEKCFTEPDRKVSLKIRLSNSGETVWLHRPRKAGWVAIALRTETLGAPDYREALPRHKLPRNVTLGDELVLELDFYLPEDYGSRSWYLDLVNEGFFWFSERGTEPIQVSEE